MPSYECDEPADGTPKIKSTGESPVDGQERLPTPPSILECQHEDGCNSQVLFASRHCAIHIVFERPDHSKRRRLREWLETLQELGGAIGTETSRPNFKDAVFGDKVLRVLNGMDFVGCDMQRAKFLHISLDDSRFENCDLTDSRFSHSSLVNVKLKDCTLVRTTFDHCDLSRSRIENIDFEDGCLRGTHNNGEMFRSAEIHKVKFIRCMLEDVNFTHAKIRDMEFIGRCTFKNTRMTKRQWRQCVTFDHAARSESVGKITLVDPLWLERLRGSLRAVLYRWLLGSPRLILARWIFACFLLAAALAVLGIGVAHSAGLTDATNTSYWVVTGILGASILSISAPGYRTHKRNMAAHTRALDNPEPLVVTNSGNKTVET